ncbi:hypothetical protein ACFQE0_10740 [Methylobacterium komagatae]|uniref:Uncharacterized protein n=1 Tax=Methylobacterium komagatae TaxID=374425 RepID=A0ABW2BJB2_9HYPH
MTTAMITYWNGAWPMCERDTPTASDRLGSERHRTVQSPIALRLSEPNKWSGDIILDLALCLILAATIIAVLMQAL